MKLFYIIITFALITQCKTATHTMSASQKQSVQIDTTQFNDPYRYLEKVQDSAVISWFKSQDNVAESALNKLANRELLLKLLTNNEDSQTLITKLSVRKNNIYYLKKTTQDKYAKLYKKIGFKGNETLLFDPKSYENGLKINYFNPSFDEQKIAIGLSKDDTEFAILKILDVKSLQLLPDILYNAYPNALGGVAWLPDNSGFSYTFLPSINKKDSNFKFNGKAILYRIGDFNSSKNDVFSNTSAPDLNIPKQNYPVLQIYKNSKYVLGISADNSPYRTTYIALFDKLLQNKQQWKLLFSKKDKIRNATILGDSIYYKTALQATNYKLCKTALANLDFANPTTIIPEDKEAVLTDYTINNKGLFFVKTKNGISAKLYHKVGSKIIEIPIPKPAAYINVSSLGIESDKLWIRIKGWGKKEERYQYDFEKERFSLERLSPKSTYPSLENIVIEEIEIPSHDGVMVPLSIVYNKSMKKNGKNPLFMSGYGAYGYTYTPKFERNLLIWLNQGGVYASAHVRGGGEKGANWHKAGKITTKANTWKDFIVCTEYLINHKYADAKKIVAWSASAGGIMIGRAITERPDLYAAAIIDVGILNTSRYGLTNRGKGQAVEFGSRDNPEELKALIAMDSYLHIQKGKKYPAVLLTVGMTDPRLPAWQPAKFAARLQDYSVSNKPVLLSVDFKMGHGKQISNEKANQLIVNRMAFALWQTGHPDFQPK